MTAFSTPKPITFTVDDESFTTVGALPALKILEGEAEALAGRPVHETIVEFLELALEPESAGRLLARLRGETAPAIDAKTMRKIVNFISQEVSGRPLLEPAASTDGSEATGTPSTDGAPSEASTPEPSHGTDASTLPTGI